MNLWFRCFSKYGHAYLDGGHRGYFSRHFLHIISDSIEEVIVGINSYFTYPNTSSSDRGHYSRSNYFLPCGLFIRSAPFNICKTFPHHHTSNKERTMLEIKQITSKHCYIFKKIRNSLKHKLMSVSYTHLTLPTKA